ncbi:MAG: four helix bundle protein [Bacteroidetes bacterium]|nr:four helix bundle protein [Bacteroidota bacterium]
MRNFRELNIWKKGIEIAKAVYAILPELPDYENFGLRVQMAKSSSSIPSNIAEGCGKSSNKDFKRYLEISLGSAYELETQLILAYELHGIKTEPIINSVKEEQMMISSLIQTLLAFSIKPLAF